MDFDKLPKWENCLIEEETINDNLKRPPLVGTDRYVPNGLYDLDWKKTSDAYGSGELTPYYIEALTSNDNGDVEFGGYGLYSATTHQGSVYTSSQKAIPFLADILVADAADGKDIACHFLSRIAFGESHFILSPASFYKTRYYGTVRKYQKEIKSYYDISYSSEAQGILTFFPKILPNQIDFLMKTALKASRNNQKEAYVWQASSLIAQGFLATERNFSEKGYPKYASQIDGQLVFDHIRPLAKLRIM